MPSLRLGFFFCSDFLSQHVGRGFASHVPLNQFPPGPFMPSAAERRIEARTAVIPSPRMRGEGYEGMDARARATHGSVAEGEGQPFKVLTAPFALSPFKDERDPPTKPSKEIRNSVMSSPSKRANYSHRARPHVGQPATEAHRIPGTISPTRPMPSRLPNFPAVERLPG